MIKVFCDQVCSSNNLLSRYVLKYIPVAICVLTSSRWPAMCIHGDKSQPERDWVLSGKPLRYRYMFDRKLSWYCLINHSVLCCVFPEFRSGKAPILIATDVASRGLGMFLYFTI